MSLPQMSSETAIVHCQVKPSTDYHTHILDLPDALPYPKTKTMPAELQHQKLGRVLGVDGGKTTAFLGIPYATLENAFAEAKPFTNSDGHDIDATNLG